MFFLFACVLTLQSTVCVAFCIHLLILFSRLPLVSLGLYALLSILTVTAQSGNISHNFLSLLWLTLFLLEQRYCSLC